MEKLTNQGLFADIALSIGITVGAIVLANYVMAHFMSRKSVTLLQKISNTLDERLPKKRGVSGRKRKKRRKIK